MKCRSVSVIACLSSNSACGSGSFRYLATFIDSIGRLATAGKRLSVLGLRGISPIDVQTIEQLEDLARGRHAIKIEIKVSRCLISPDQNMIIRKMEMQSHAGGPKREGKTRTRTGRARVRVK